MPLQPFLLVAPATRGLSLAITRNLLCSTEYPIYVTHRLDSPDIIRRRILEPLKDVDPDRLLTSPKARPSFRGQYSSAADALVTSLREKYGEAYLHMPFSQGVNTISHLLYIKYFSQFLPSSKLRGELSGPTRWVHMSAHLGSISDNQRGGWFSYRSSKAALNQIVKTFDSYLKINGKQAICVGMHPGTVKTDLSKEFWQSCAVNNIFEPQEAAENVVRVIRNLDEDQRGKVWDWDGKEVPW